jgi:uncharacterized linocin/CFP29 family protein
MALMAAHGGISGLRGYREKPYRDIDEFYMAVAAGTAMLPKDTWKQLDAEVRTASQGRLNFIQDMIDLGLVQDLESVGVLLAEWEQLSDPGDAIQAMSSRNRSDLQDVDYTLNATPVPMTMFDFQLEWRRLEASMRNGSTPLDTALIRSGTQKVAQKLEDVAFNGNSEIVLNGNSLPGIAQNTANTGALTAAWTAAGADPVQDVINMKGAIVEQGSDFPPEGPFNVYIPLAYEKVLDEEYKAESDRTLRQKLESIAGINAVKSSSKVPDGTVVMVHMDLNTVSLRDAIGGIVPVSWDIEGGFAMNFKIMAIQTLVIKSDIAGNTGIAVYSAP